MLSVLGPDSPGLLAALVSSIPLQHFQALAHGSKEMLMRIIFTKFLLIYATNYALAFTYQLCS